MTILRIAKTASMLLASALTLGACTSYNQVHTTLEGSMAGGALFSTIGGITGGYRGHQVGGAIGMLVGGAAGAAIGADLDRREKEAYEDRYAPGDYAGSYDGVDYGYTDRQESRRAAADWRSLSVENVRFVESRQDRRFNAGERATLVMEIYNRGDAMLYNIAPQVTCDNKRVAISPTAVVSQLAPGRGFRYTVEIIAPQRLRTPYVTFHVGFGTKKNKTTARTFRLRTDADSRR